MNLFELHIEQFSYTFSIFKEEYFGILTFLSIAIILASVIAGLSYSLISQNPESEKLSSYECGFEPYEDTKNKFDIKFCLVAILFILFDIEVIFLLPWSVTLSQLNLLGFWSMIDFLLELGIGFVYAWRLHSLDW